MPDRNCEIYPHVIAVPSFIAPGLLRKLPQHVARKLARTSRKERKSAVIANDPEGHMHCGCSISEEEQRLQQLFQFHVLPSNAKSAGKSPLEIMLMAKGQKDNAHSNGSTVRFPLASLLSDGDSLEKSKATKSYARGVVLFGEGQQSRGVYLLSEGRAKISIGSSEGKTLVLRIAQPGDLLGVNAALTGEPYSATAETIERCRVDFISVPDLLKLLERDKKACLRMAQSLGRTLSSVIDHSRLLLLSQSATEKLARLLVRWCDELGKPTTRGIEINSGLTHEEMAQMICASRETVTRVLNEFKRADIVDLFNGTILIRNRTALATVARC